MGSGGSSRGQLRSGRRRTRSPRPRSSTPSLASKAAPVPSRRASSRRWRAPCRPSRPWEECLIRGSGTSNCRRFSEEQALHVERMRERKYKVVIKHASAISLQQLRMLLAGYPTDIPAQALQVLDILLHDVVFNQCNSVEYITVGRSFTKDSTLDVEAWKWLFQSIRLMQNGLSARVDVSSSVFAQPLLLIDFVQRTLKIDVFE